MAGIGERNQRLYDSCDVVDNEVHFLWQCKKHDILRLKMMAELENCN